MDKQFNYCPIEITLRAIGGKYKPVILFHLLKGARRYKELQREIPGVSQRMLTLHLKELERDGLVSRHSFPTVPPRVEYAITEYGRSLESVLQAMNTWGKSQATPSNDGKDDSTEARNEGVSRDPRISHLPGAC
jgi:DNA-binding HxlR family transcriptional regulator